MIIESGPDFRYSQLGSLLGGYSVKGGPSHLIAMLTIPNYDFGNDYYD